jgi:catechol 2,3-dioxygenase-like lactoylglutathione lyase family enzyme
LGYEDGFFHVFSHVEIGTGITRENPVFAINQSKTPLGTENRGFMINFRVDDLDVYLNRLVGHGVTQDREMIVWERGKHAWVRDPDGNLIELYEELKR